MKSAAAENNDLGNNSNIKEHKATSAKSLELNLTDTLHSLYVDLIDVSSIVLTKLRKSMREQKLGFR